MSLPPNVSLVPAAHTDLAKTLSDFIDSTDSPDLANDYKRAVTKTLTSLATFPRMGTKLFSQRDIYHVRMFPVVGFHNFLVFYVQFDDLIVVARIIHGSRDRRELFPN